MKKIIIIFLFLSFGCNAQTPIALEKADSDLTFVLNNVSILFESTDPDNFPGVLRIIELPDRADDCSWIEDLTKKSSARLEDDCPQKLAYVALSNWDIAPEQSAFLIGRALSWRFAGVDVLYRNSQSDWQALLKLEKEALETRNKNPLVIKVRITNRYDRYTVEIIA